MKVLRRSIADECSGKVSGLERVPYGILQKRECASPSLIDRIRSKNVTRNQIDSEWVLISTDLRDKWLDKILRFYGFRDKVGSRFL
jgi:hypothetical protein